MEAWKRLLCGGQWRCEAGWVECKLSLSLLRSGSPFHTASAASCAAACATAADVSAADVAAAVAAACAAAVAA